jgi:hypothetical protein
LQAKLIKKDTEVESQKGRADRIQQQFENYKGEVAGSLETARKSQTVIVKTVEYFSMLGAKINDNQTPTDNLMEMVESLSLLEKTKAEIFSREAVLRPKEDLEA